MKKRLLAILVLGLTTATTACAIAPAMQKKYERSGCTQMSELNGCDVNKSYEWNRAHGFIENTNSQQNRHHRHGDDRQSNSSEEQSGSYARFAGNYVAKFENGKRSVDIHVDGYGVYVNGNEVKDINAYKDTMTFRSGYATYTLKENGRGSWNDSDSGNAGKIVRE